MCWLTDSLGPLDRGSKQSNPVPLPTMPPAVHQLVLVLWWGTALHVALISQSKPGRVSSLTKAANTAGRIQNTGSLANTASVTSCNTRRRGSSTKEMCCQLGTKALGISRWSQSVGPGWFLMSAAWPWSKKIKQSPRRWRWSQSIRHDRVWERAAVISDGAGLGDDDRDVPITQRAHGQWIREIARNCR